MEIKKYQRKKKKIGQPQTKTSSEKNSVNYQQLLQEKLTMSQERAGTEVEVAENNCIISKRERERAMKMQ